MCPCPLREQIFDPSCIEQLPVSLFDINNELSYLDVSYYNNIHTFPLETVLAWIEDRYPAKPKGKGWQQKGAAFIIYWDLYNFYK